MYNDRPARLISLFHEEIIFRMDFLGHLYLFALDILAIEARLMLGGIIIPVNHPGYY